MSKRTLLYIGVVAIYFAGIGCGWYLGHELCPAQPDKIRITEYEYKPPAYVTIHISLNKSVFQKNEEGLFIIVNLTNNGNATIYGEDYCYNFILTFPNGTKKELFIAANGSCDYTLPSESNVRERWLYQYSFDDNSKYKGIEELLEHGVYKIYAIYKSSTAKPTPWWSAEDMAQLPYGETTSNEIEFEVTP